jgi:CBS domain-containing protein
MNTIRQILADKGSEIWSIAPTQTVFEAIQLMAIRRVGALLVMDGQHLAGIISERDYAREVILKGRSSKDTPIKDIMTTDVVTITPEIRIEESLTLMTEHRVRHLPVLVEGEVAGMISIGDLVKEIIKEQRSTIEQLENYIKG